MTIENAKDLQLRLAKEAVALMVFHGECVHLQPFKESIVLIGEAWDVPVGDTNTSLELINQEWNAVRVVEDPEDAHHVLPEKELPMNATGDETLSNIWGLFESAMQLESKEKRMVLYNMARQLEEIQNLQDWFK